MTPNEKQPRNPDKVHKETYKKVIKALATAPAVALRELLRQTPDEYEREQVRRIASAFNIKL